MTDFGAGFYTTTNLAEAESWADNKAMRVRAAKIPLIDRTAAAVLCFSADRNMLATLKGLCFVREDRDYWDLVKYNRGVRGVEDRQTPVYDMVCGPVSLWPDFLVISDWDQFSFHTASGLNALGLAGEVIPPHDTGSGLFRKPNGVN